MIDYIVHDAKGNILRVGKCMPSMLSIQASADGEFALEGVARDDKDFIDIATNEVREIPPKPTDNSAFDTQRQEWVEVVTPIEVVAANAIAHRNMLLFRSDWTQLPDVPLATKAAWAEYRQALRDITAQAGFPRDIIWPVPPA